MRLKVFAFVCLLLLSGPAYGQQNQGVSGSITATSSNCTSTSCVLYSLPQNSSVNTVALQVDGTFVATLQFEAVIDGTYGSIVGYPIGSATTATSTTATGIWQFSVAGISAIRVRASAYTSGTATIKMQPSNLPFTTGDAPGGGGVADMNVAEFGGTAVSAFISDASNISTGLPLVPSASLLYQWNGAAWVPVTTSDTVPVVGNKAHDDADAGNPIKIGCKAIAYGTTPTAVTVGDRSDIYCDRAGVPFINQHPNTVTYAQQYTSANTNAAVVTVSAGTKIVVQRVGFACNPATTESIAFRIGFGTASVPAYGNAGIILASGGMQGSSFTGKFYGGPWVAGADDEDLRITSDDPTGACEIEVAYFTIAS